jgi:hypothetical protein
MCVNDAKNKEESSRMVAKEIKRSFLGCADPQAHKEFCVFDAPTITHYS